jgi:hypothetical protein
MPGRSETPSYQPEIHGRATPCIGGALRLGIGHDIELLTQGNQINACHFVILSVLANLQIGMEI